MFCAVVSELDFSTDCPEAGASGWPGAMALEMATGRWEIVGFPVTMFCAVAPELVFPMSWLEPEDSSRPGTMVLELGVGRSWDFLSPWFGFPRCQADGRGRGKGTTHPSGVVVPSPLPVLVYSHFIL
jgi:hypothetical protein